MFISSKLSPFGRLREFCFQIVYQINVPWDVAFGCGKFQNHNLCACDLFVVAQEDSPARDQEKCVFLGMDCWSWCPVQLQTLSSLEGSAALQ